jgi:serine/threonine protein kinase
MANDSHRNALRPGYMVHWYRIERILGQGGFGITYLAEDTNLNQRVAVKEYLPLEVAMRESDFSVHPVSENHSESFIWGLERFVEEARTLARFDHPNIVRVLSVFEMNNTAYMVMRYEHGRSLQQMLAKRATLEESQLIETFFPILEGLERVHAVGFIHRDVKPANVFVREDGTPVLLDFGSARQSLGEATRTLTTLVSPGYAPFEQYFSNSDRQGPWTDIYGLGATLYRAVTGVAPMNAVDRSEGIIKHDTDPLIPAAEVAAGRYSPQLLDAIDWALSFGEDSRPQNIDQWRQALGGDLAPPIASTVQAEARTAAVGAAEHSNQELDLVLEPTLQSQPAKTASLVREKPKRRKRYWIAAAAALLFLFIGLNADKDNQVAGPAAAEAPQTPLAPTFSTPEYSALDGADQPPIEDIAAAPSTQTQAAEPSTSAWNAAKTPQTDNQMPPPIAPKAPEATASKETQIARLLDSAMADIDQLRLSTPPGNSALDKYRQVLALDPHNQEARNGVHEITQTYAELGKQAAKRKDYDRASFFIDQALAIAPDSKPLKRAQRRLERIRLRKQ